MLRRVPFVRAHLVCQQLLRATIRTTQTLRDRGGRRRRSHLARSLNGLKAMYRAAIHGNFLTHTRRDKPRSDSFARSALKALSYRVLIVSLDFSVLYLFTRKFSIALGFTAASNLYTTIAYLLHERAWARITWGRREVSQPSGDSHAPTV